MILVGFAVALTFSSVAGALLVLLAAVIFDRVVIRREEAYLTRRFGNDYRAYLNQVRRWF